MVSCWCIRCARCLVRLAGLQGGWSYFLPVSGVLAQSGFFEVVEAMVAMVVSPELAACIWGTQGDEWDAQKDMAAAFAGAALTMMVTAWVGTDRSVDAA